MHSVQGEEGGAFTRRDLLKRGAGGAAALALSAGAAGALGAAADAIAAPARAPYALGFTSMTAETRVPALPVEGTIPSWVSGSLLRNGPALFEVGEEQFNHWFDGLAMLHAFSIERGRVGYANRFLRSSAYEAWKRQGKILYSEFGTDPCRSVFSGVSSIPISAPIPNANVSLEAWANGFRAHTEVPIPVRFDPATLATLGVEAGSTGQMGTAHPHGDLVTRERFSYEVSLAPPKTGVRVLVEKAGKVRELAFLEAAEPGYMHSFALTPRYVVLFQQPFIVNPGSFLTGPPKPIVEHFRWVGSQPAKVVVIDRHKGGVVRTIELDPFFVFHHVNAHERGGTILMDVSGHIDSRIIDALYLKNLRRADQRMPPVKLRRLTIDVARGKVQAEQLADASIELPRVNYGRVNQHAYRYAYGIGQRSPASGFVDQLVKIDVARGSARLWREPGAYPGEPVFVARPNAAREDDGVVLSVVLDARRRTSYLLVLDGRTFEERARAAVPHHIPFGFHGIFAKA